jgi:hypothetical protein
MEDIEMETTDITNLAPYLIEIVRAHSEVDRGTVDFSLSKSLGEVVGLRTSEHRVVNFNNSDNREVMVMIADTISKLPKDENAEVTFKVVTKAGDARKLVITTEHQRKINVDK